MAKIPDPLERRHLIEQKLSAEAALGIAEAYMEAGRMVEAVDFLVKAEANEQLDRVKEDAVRNGDAFLLQVVVRATGGEIPASTWERVAENADSSGRDRYATTARRMLSRSEV